MARLLAKVAALFNPKASLLIQGQRKLIQKIREAFVDNHSPVIWVHCASLGEFEQGRPVIEAFRNQYPTHKILLTFFSPSGYEVMKDYEGADHVFYLPMDSPSNANKFIEAINPSLVLWVKYEYWF